MDLFLLTSSNKWQIYPLIREGAPHGQGSNCQPGTNIWSRAPMGARYPDCVPASRNVISISTILLAVNSTAQVLDDRQVWQRGRYMSVHQINIGKAPINIPHMLLYKGEFAFIRRFVDSWNAHSSDVCALTKHFLRWHRLVTVYGKFWRWKTVRLTLEIYDGFSIHPMLWHSETMQFVHKTRLFWTNLSNDKRCFSKWHSPSRLCDGDSMFSMQY
jgi:hypothetical protein